MLTRFTGWMVMTGTRGKADFGRAAIAPNDEAVLICTAVWLERQGRYEAAMAVARRIIEAYPRNANGYVRLARSKTYCGEAEDAIPLLEKAIRLDPYEPHLFDRYWRLGFALLLNQRERDAVQWLQRSLGARLDGSAQTRSCLLAASYASLGEVDRARLILSEFVDDSMLMTLRCLGHENYRSATYAEQYARYQHGLRLAGFRDHGEDAVLVSSRAMICGLLLPATRRGRLPGRKRSEPTPSLRFSSAMDRSSSIRWDTSGAPRCRMRLACRIRVWAAD
jgi:tetratricopeptide (TPR) repeat protein